VTGRHRAIYQTNRWHQLARRVVKEEPICWLRLPGCTIRATTADHIIPVSIRPDLALVRSNCRGACHSCNSLRRDVPIAQLRGLRGQPMTREEALDTIQARRFRQRAPALAIFDGPAIENNSTNSANSI
jgi:hypothetical protein